jgi:hypothetical protein
MSVVASRAMSNFSACGCATAAWRAKPAARRMAGSPYGSSRISIFDWGIVRSLHLMFYAPYKTAKDVGYDSVSPTMVPYLTGSGVGPESLLVVAADKPSQQGSSSDAHKH